MCGIQRLAGKLHLVARTVQTVIFTLESCFFSTAMPAILQWKHEAMYCDGLKGLKPHSCRHCQSSGVFWPLVPQIPAIWALIDQGLERQGTLPKGSAEPLRSSGY